MIVDFKEIYAYNHFYLIFLLTINEYLVKKNKE